MLAFVLFLLFSVHSVFAGPSWQAAPASLRERPAIAAPIGGWWTEDGQYARVHVGADDRALARRLADHAAIAVPTLARRVGAPSGGALDIYVAPTQAEFEALQPGAPPEWADGTAWPEWGIVFLRAPSVRPGTAEPLEQVLDHELVHVLVGRAFAPRPAPRWLQEGLAQYWTGELGPKVGTDLSSVLFGRDQLFSLRQLSSGFYGDAVRARHAYAASADFIGFLASHHGEGAVRGLVAEMAGGASFENALRAVTGERLADVESAWRGRWSAPAAVLNALGSMELLWGIGGVLLVLGGLRARRRTKARLARWEREERWAQEPRWVAGMQEPLPPWVH